MKVSAATIAVVSAVNPNHPGAFLFLATWFIFFTTLLNPALAQPSFQTRTAMNNAIYHNSLLTITPMLFHHVELGMSYESILNLLGKSALYCDSGESYCKAENGLISKSCIRREFIQPNKAWMCHWDGLPASRYPASNLEIWLLGDHVTEVTAKMPDGAIYRRDSGNTIYLETAPA